jgi:hypothetical protein
LPDDAWKLAIAITTPATFLLESVRRRTPGLTELAVRFGERGLERQAQRGARAGEVSYVPTTLPAPASTVARRDAALRAHGAGATLPAMFAPTTTTTTEVTTPRG